MDTTATAVLVEPSTDGFPVTFGASVAGVDADQDGLSDVVVGAYNAEKVFVYRGSSEGVETTAVTVLQSPSRSDFDYSLSMDEAGDVNGDGHGDLVIAARRSYGGAAYVHLSSPSGFDATPAGAWDIPADVYGVGGAGDVNGDCYGDVIVGAPPFAYVYHGGPGSLSSATYDTLAAPVSGGYFGLSATAAGDVDGDGFGDVMVANGDVSGPNQAWLYPGGPDGVVDAPNELPHGAWAVASAGDSNGDGYDDILAVSERNTTTYWMPGSVGGIDAATVSRLEQLGYSLAPAGDIDRDGYDDVVVGDRYGATASVHLGSAAGLGLAPATTVSGSASDEFGYAVAGLGDVDGDTWRDIAVGARWAEGDGAVYVYRGYGEAPDTGAADPDPELMPCEPGAAGDTGGPDDQPSDPGGSCGSPGGCAQSGADASAAISSLALGLILRRRRRTNR